MLPMMIVALTSQSLISSDSLENLFLFALTGAMGFIAWYIKKLDTRITENANKKVDKEDFQELKRDMRKGFEDLNREIHYAARDSGDQKLSLAVLVEKMTRVEMMLQSDDFQRCRNCTNFSEVQRNG